MKHSFPTPTPARLCAAAVLLALAAQGHAAVDPKAGAKARLTPIVKPTPASVAAMRAAAEARATPVPVKADLPALGAEQIAERNASARGGLAAWQGIDSMTLAGKLDAGKTRRDGGQVAVVGQQARSKAKADLRKAIQTGQVKPADEQQVIQLPFQMDLKRPLLTRLEIPFQGDTAVQVYDGANGWKLRPFLGRHEVESFSADEMKQAASQQQLDGALINHKAKGTQVEVEGAEMIEGRGAYRLKLTLKNGEVRHLWVDGQTFLDTKIDSAPKRWDGRMRTVVTYFRDYRKVSGVTIAHRLETRIEGVPGAENIYIEKVALNPALGPSRFAKPE